MAGAMTGPGSVLFNMLFANFVLDVGKDFTTSVPATCNGNDTVCYDIYDVLEEFSLQPPWAQSSTRPVKTVPFSPQQLQTEFRLFTRTNQTAPVVLDLSNTTSLYTAPLAVEGKVVVVVHGYGSRGDVAWAKTLKGELLRSQGGSNVVLVDWSRGARAPYIQAVSNLRVVARQLAHFVHTMQKLLGFPSDRFHVIGHSLGAHLCGIAGAYLQDIYNIVLPRISGLDPAHPYHNQLELSTCLDSSDATFVDIIHSDNTSILGFPLTVGMMASLGHLDYYPNGGGSQPGCEGGSLKCAHVRAISYFVDSIRQECQFIATRCPSYEAFMQGECWGCEAPYECSRVGLFSTPLDVPLDSRFYLLTKDRSPFCDHHYRVTIRVSNSSQALDHDGEFGILLLKMEGHQRKAHPIRLSEKSVYYRAGTEYGYVVLAPSIGPVIRVRLTFLYPGHFINPMSWRMVEPRMHLNRVTIQRLGDTHTSEFCFEAAEQKSDLEYVLTTQDICAPWDSVGDDAALPNKEEEEGYAGSGEGT